MVVKTSRDYDLTDYAALEAFIDRFVASAIGTICSLMPIWSASRLRTEVDVIRAAPTPSTPALQAAGMPEMCRANSRAVPT